MMTGTLADLSPNPLDYQSPGVAPPAVEILPGFVRINGAAISAHNITSVQTVQATAPAQTRRLAGVYVAAFFGIPFLLGGIFQVAIGCIELFADGARTGVPWVMGAALLAAVGLLLVRFAWRRWKLRQFTYQLVIATNGGETFGIATNSPESCRQWHDAILSIIREASAHVDARQVHVHKG